jgi:hypothetical protein
MLRGTDEERMKAAGADGMRRVAMRAVKVEADGTLKLPKEILRVFPSASELAVWTEGDTIVLKRVKPVRASEIAERVPARELPLAEIAGEVHQMRRERRRRRA